MACKRHGEHIISRMKTILLDKFEKENKNKTTSKVEYNPYFRNDYDNRTLYKLDRSQNNKKTRYANPLAICFLYVSISFNSIQTFYEHIEHLKKTNNNYIKDSESEIEKEREKIFAKCLVILYQYSEFVLDKRHHFRIEKFYKSFVESSNFGYNAASSMNSYVWLFCIKCLGKGKTKLMEKGKCPICNNRKRKVTKPYHKSLQKIKFNVINDILFNMRYYFYFLEFISNITNLIKMEESAKSVYLSIFKEQEEQFIKTKLCIS